MQIKGNRLLKLTITSIFAAAAVYLLLSNIQPRRIPETLSRVPIQTLIIGFLMYLFFVLLKTLRFNLILNINLPLKRLFPIIATHTFWTNLLPMRAGDASYVYLLKSREKVSATKSVASLVVVSILDILLLLMLIIGIAWHFKSRLEGKISYTLFLVIPSMGILILLSIIATSLVLPKPLVRIANRIVSVFQRLKFPILTWIANKSAGVINELTDVSFNLRFLSIFAYSIVILVSRFGIQCYLVKAMSLNLSILEILFALAFTAFCNMFPIQSIAGLGAVEAPWAWALISLGASKSEAIASGFSLHIIIILYSVIMGLLGIINYSRRKNFFILDMASL